MSNEPVLAIDDLVVEAPGANGRVRLVDGVSFPCTRAARWVSSANRVRARA